MKRCLFLLGCVACLMTAAAPSSMAQTPNASATILNPFDNENFLMPTEFYFDSKHKVWIENGTPYAQLTGSYVFKQMRESSTICAAGVFNETIQLDMNGKWQKQATFSTAMNNLPAGSYQLKATSDLSINGGASASALHLIRINVSWTP